MTDATTTVAPKPARKSKAVTAPKPAATRRAKAPKSAKPAKAPKAPKPEREVATAKAPSKIDQVVALLRREEGATTKALMEATSWQAHSVRGIIAGAVKRKLGLTVTSTKIDGERVYRIQAGEPA